MKIKYKSLIITFLAVILTLAFSQVYAVSDQFYYPKFRTGDKVGTGSVRWAITHTTGIGTNDAGYFILPEEVISGDNRTDNNRTPVYCVEAGVDARDIDGHKEFHYTVISDPARFSSLTKISEEVLKKLCLISYFGWGTSPESAGLTDEIAMGTQLAIWDTIGGGNGIEGRATSAEGPKNWAKTILERTEKAMLKPSIDSTETEVLIGRPVTITDNNGVLENYTITSNAGGKYTVNKSGNSITIDGLEVGEYTITLERNFKTIAYNKGPLLFYDADYQDVMIFGQPQKIQTQFKIKVIGIPITIQKLDADTDEAKPVADAKLEGAVYGIYDDNGEEVERLTLDATGKAKSKPLPPARYTIQEIKAPEGYVLSNTAYSILLDTSDLDPIFYVEDEVIRGKLKINKVLQKSDYDEAIPLSGAQFTIKLLSTIGTAEEAKYTFVTNESGDDGVCEYDGLPYGEYEVEETKVPKEALKVEKFTFKIENDGEVKTYGNEKETIQECDENGKLIDTSKKMKIIVRKQDYDADIYGKNKAGSYGWTQGDATFKGAQYTIYRKYENGVLSDVVDTITIDHQNADGYWCAESKYMWTGTYYVKETKRPEGYLIDENVYTFSQDPATQVEEKITIERALENGGRSTEKVERGRVEVVKFDQNTDKDEKVPAAGAKLWLVLNSTVTGGVDGKTSSEIKEIKGMTYYEVTIDDKGYAEFIDEIYRAEYPEDEYTIPYGKYTIIEVKGSDSGEHTHFFSKPQEVAVKNQGENKYYILGEEIVPMYLQIQKTDKDSGEDVQIAGAKYMVWNVAKDEFVKQKFTPDGEYETVFETGPNGMITLPEKLEAGNYIIYEIEAPKGYYLDEEYKLPVNESDYGNIEKGGALFTIDKEALGVEPDSTGEKVDLYFKAEIANTPLKAKLQIVKTGEQFTGVNQVTDEYKNKYTVTKPKFENKGLKGVTYEIYAAEDIKSKDGRYTYVTAGTKVDTITTNADGIAETKELYCGEYRIVETVTPKGYITDNNIPNVVLKNEGPEKVKTTVKELNNVRQKLSVMIDKVFEDVKYASSQEIKKEAVFGIYANQDFTYSNGDLAIAKNTLVATTKVVEGVAQDTDSIDLPEGEYYVKELEASYPYTILDETKNVTLKYDSNGKEKLTFGAGEFINVPETATVTLIKLSTSTLEDVVLNGNEIDTSKLDEEVQALLKELSGKSTEEVKSYLQERNVKFVAGAKYGVYIDENCTEPLYMEDDEGQLVQAIMETDDTGLITMGEVPLGTYYFKEIEAPVGYELSKDTIKLELTLENKDAVVYQALVEEPVVSRFITKTDIFTGDVIPDCVFEIKDEEGKVLLHDKTDKKGNAYIPLDLFKEGETYQFVEIEAPEIYDLNTEPHEFTAHFDEDGRWAVEKMNVENRRKTGKVTVLKTDEKTGEPLEGCKFSIVLLDENGNEYVNAQGDKVYLVENAVTGEDGKYVIEEAPYGTYKFIEVEAPEGYEKVEEEMENYVFEVNEESQEVLFEVTNTGDIAVYVLCVVALVSIFGIVYVTRKTEKENY